MTLELRAQDANGRELKRGDRVLIPCRVVGVLRGIEYLDGLPATSGGAVFLAPEHLSPTGRRHAFTLPGPLVVLVEPGISSADLFRGQDGGRPHPAPPPKKES